MLGSRLPKNRKFSYEPLYYDPEKDEQAKRRIHFKSNARKKAAKQRSLIWLITLFALALYFVIYFARIGQAQ